MTATKKATEFTIINRADGSIQGHRAGCRDIARARKADGIFAGEPWTAAWLTKHEAWVDYNSDFLAEGPESGQWPIEWLPCADHLPQGAPDTYESYLTNDLGQPVEEGTEPTTTEKENTVSKTQKPEPKAPSTPNVRTYDTSAKALIVKALGVDCTIPYCRATPDESCRSAKGLEVEPHTRRVQKALAMEKAAAKKAAKLEADALKAAAKAAAKPAGKKASTKKAEPKPEPEPVVEEIAAVCKPCLTRHHKSCKGTVEAPCGCESKVHAA